MSPQQSCSADKASEKDGKSQPSSGSIAGNTGSAENNNRPSVIDVQSVQPAPTADQGAPSEQASTQPGSAAAPVASTEASAQDSKSATKEASHGSMKTKRAVSDQGSKEPQKRKVSPRVQSIFKWKPLTKEELTTAKRNKPDRSKFVVTLVDSKTGEVVRKSWTQCKIDGFDWSDKEHVKELNKWRNQTHTRQGFQKGARTVRWTVEEEEILRKITHRAMKTAKRAKNLDWKKINRKLWSSLRGKKHLKGMEYSRSTRAAPLPKVEEKRPAAENSSETSAEVKKPARKPQTQVVKQERMYEKRKATAVQRQAWTLQSVLAELRRDNTTAAAPAEGATHASEEDDAEFSCGDMSDSSSDILSDEEYESSDSDEDKEGGDLDPILEEESDDEQDRMRPVGNPLGATLVSVC